ncbi:MAG: PaaI family thioesterase, partial [Myxococcaceae bacterium]|nr:PaaI family thioesterase [Myxococcaceae bacterium]
AGFQEFIPHNKALGLRITRVGTEPPWAELCLPWDERLIGNPDTRALHGGVLSTLLDTAGGAAVYLALKEPTPIATLDLRVDFLGPPMPELPVHARAECVKTTRNVAFVRMTASHAPDGPPLATASATYMLSTRGKSVTPKEVATSAMEEP